MIPMANYSESKARWQLNKEKDITTFAQELVEYANDLKYDQSRRKGPAPMDLDSVNREGNGEGQGEEWAAEDWANWSEEWSLDWMGKAGRKKGGKKGKGGAGKGTKGGKRTMPLVQQDGQRKRRLPRIQKVES